MKEINDLETKIYSLSKELVEEALFKEISIHNQFTINRLENEIKILKREIKLLQILNGTNTRIQKTTKHDVKNISEDYGSYCFRQS